MKRIVAKAGDILIGGENPIVVQTMCNTQTVDVKASYDQCIEMVKAGAQLIRLTVQGNAQVEAMKELRDALRKNGVNVPIVADIHFRSDVALAVAPFVEKVRVNPGNFNKDHSKACADFRELIKICREHGTAIRIGVNHGSLGERITSVYGNTSEGMAKAVMEWLEMCIDEEFFNVVVSLKASNTVVMVDAYRILWKYMEESGYIFPVHLGVTEAGNGDAARIKSAVAISTLLSEGIGDTIRVSLTEDPVAELSVAKALADRYALRYKGPEGERTIPESYAAKSWEDLLVSVCCDYGKKLLDREIDNVSLKGSFIDEKGNVVPLDSAMPEGGLSYAEYLENELLQACRRKFYRPEYIACPGCGRTMFSLEKVFNEVKRRTSGMGNVCIAVMGCIVNGPGEMADADFGYVGEGRGLVSIYRGHDAVYRHIPEDEAIDKLLELISDGR